MKRAALHDGTTVRNVIVYDPTGDYTPADGLTLVELADDDAVGPGWDVTPAGGFAPPPSLTADPSTIPADGATTSTVTYTNHGTSAPATVTFDVNGATTDVPLTSGVAAIDVTAATPGPVVVTCAGLTATITAGA